MRRVTQTDGRLSNADTPDENLIHYRIDRSKPRYFEYVELRRSLCPIGVEDVHQILDIFDHVDSVLGASSDVSPA